MSPCCHFCGAELHDTGIVGAWRHPATLDCDGSGRPVDPRMVATFKPEPALAALSVWIDDAFVEIAKVVKVTISVIDDATRAFSKLMDTISPLVQAKLRRQRLRKANPSTHRIRPSRSRRSSQRIARVMLRGVDF